jgi:hypothetical protein
MVKETYVKPAIKSEILKAEVLNQNWGSGCNGGNEGWGGYWWWCR